MVFSTSQTQIISFFRKTITNENGFVQINIPPGAYGIKSLIDEIKRITIDEEHYTEAN